MEVTDHVPTSQMDSLMLTDSTTAGWYTQQTNDVILGLCEGTTFTSVLDFFIKFINRAGTRLKNIVSEAVLELR